MAPLVVILLSTLVLTQTPGVCCFRDLSEAREAIDVAQHDKEADHGLVARSSAEVNMSVSKTIGLEYIAALVMKKIIVATTTAMSTAMSLLTWLCSVISAWVASAQAWILGTWHAFTHTWVGYGVQMFWEHVYKGTLMAGSVITSLEAVKWESVCSMWKDIDTLNVDLSSVPLQREMGFGENTVSEMEALRRAAHLDLQNWIKSSSLDVPLQKGLLSKLGPVEEFLSLKDATVLEFLALGNCSGTGPADFRSRIVAMGGALRDFCRMPRLDRIKNKLYWHWNPIHDLSFKNPDAGYSERWDIRGLKDMAKYTFLYKTFVTLPWKLAEYMGNTLVTAATSVYTTLLFTPLIGGLFAIPFSTNEFDRMLCSVAFNTVHHPQSPMWQEAAGGQHRSYFEATDPGMSRVREHCISHSLWSGKTGECQLETDMPNDVNVAEERESWTESYIASLKGYWQTVKHKHGSLWAGTDLTKNDLTAMGVDEGEIILDDWL